MTRTLLAARALASACVINVPTVGAVAEACGEPVAEVAAPAVPVGSAAVAEGVGADAGPCLLYTSPSPRD